MARCTATPLPALAEFHYLSAMLTDTLIEDERWEQVQLGALAEKACGATLSHLGLGGARFEIVVLGADDVRIAALNGLFRGKTRPTNVLSWPSEERGAVTPGERPTPPEGPELGDIALAWEACAAEAERFGLSRDHHVTHLLVHGTLHLLGYDHETDADAELMESVEVEILGRLGLKDPYGS